jgi:hypothetical protein
VRAPGTYYVNHTDTVDHIGTMDPTGTSEFTITLSRTGTDQTNLIFLNRIFNLIFKFLILNSKNSNLI